MKENNSQNTALHLTLQCGNGSTHICRNEEIVKLLLKAFGDEDKETLIEFVMKEI